MVSLSLFINWILFVLSCTAHVEWLRQMHVEPSVAFVIEAYLFIHFFLEKLKNNIVNSEFVKMTISNLTP